MMTMTPLRRWPRQRWGWEGHRNLKVSLPTAELLYLPPPFSSMKSPLYNVFEHTNKMFSLRIWCWQWVNKSNWNTENIYFRTLTLVSGLNICTHHHKAQKQSIQFRYSNMTFWSVLCYDNAQKAQIQKSKNFPDSKSLNYPVTFWIIQKVFILFRQFLDCPDSFWIVRTVSGLGGQFLDCLDSFRIVWTVSGLSGPEVSE